MQIAAAKIQNSKVKSTLGGEESDEEYEDLKEAQSMRLNGEEVRLSMEGWKYRETVRSGITGLAFLISVVGIWGDGARV